MSISPDTPSVYRWEGVAERADRVLVHLRAVRSRSHAQQVISASRVKIAGNTITKAGQRVHPGDHIEVQGLDHYVSRGAHKLLHALERFDISAQGRIALDVGASTGGFTQVLLERGATTVLAVDVGHGQLAPELLRDERVKLWEGCNARYLTREDLAEHTGVDRPKQLLAAAHNMRPDYIVTNLSEMFEPYPATVVKKDGTVQVGNAKVLMRGHIVTVVAEGDDPLNLLRAGCQAIWRSGLAIYGLEVPDILLVDHWKPERLR